MKRLATILALGLCTGAFAQSVMSGGGSATITSRDGSTVSAGGGSSTITSRDGSTVSSQSSGGPGSVILDNQSTVTSSSSTITSTDGTGAVTQSIVGRTGSMCSAVYEGRRCEISCQAPELATCGKAEYAAAPACYCR